MKLRKTIGLTALKILLLGAMVFGAVNAVEPRLPPQLMLMGVGGAAGCGCNPIATLTDASPVTPNVDGFSGGILTTLSQNTTIANPTGTPVEFQQYTIRVKSTASRTLTFGAQYRGSADNALPAATSGASLTDYLIFKWNVADSKWDFVGRNFGF